MTKKTLLSVKDCDYICSNGRDVLVSGKTLLLFRADGTFIAEFPSIRQIHKAVFLHDNTALVESLKPHAYHYISLDDGTLLWSISKKGRYGGSVSRFAVTPDGKTVYDARHADSFRLCIDRICPQRQDYEQYIISEGLRCTYDIFCDENGILCAMQSHVVLSDDDSYREENLSQSGILAIPIDAQGPHPYWKKQWTSITDRRKNPRGSDGRFVLRDDFSVLDIDSMTEIFLVDAETLKRLPACGFTWKYDPVNQLLTVSFLTEKLNIIIDCQKRKVISRYKRDDSSVGYEGCLINAAFWMGTKSGIVMHPFPNMD